LNIAEILLAGHLGIIKSIQNSKFKPLRTSF